MDIFMTNFAVCPICTVTVGAGLALSQQLGIDDSVTSIWIGGLLASISIWTINWLKTKQKTFKYYEIVTWLAYYILTFFGLHLAGSLWMEGNSLLGIDKIILGSIIGTVVFVGASEAYQYLKKRNDGKAHFPFEKIAFPVVGLLISSLILYFITKN